MSEIPENLRYAKSHEWIKVIDTNLVQVGISDFAQDELGDLVYVDLPKVGRTVSQAEQCAVVESVKTASDLYSPVSGVVEAINQEVVDDPALVNTAAYANWLFAIRANDLAELDGLLSAQQYQEFIDA